MTTLPDGVLTYDDHQTPVLSVADSPPEQWAISETYTGMATLTLSDEQRAILTAPVDPQDVLIRPDGLIYLGQAYYRGVLCRAFGPGGWGLRRISDYALDDGRYALAEFALYVQGHYVSAATGEHETRTGRLDGDTRESCKSNALMRCCKDLGVSLELWQKTWIDSWKREYAVQDKRGWRCGEPVASPKPQPAPTKTISPESKHRMAVASAYGQGGPTPTVEVLMVTPAQIRKISSLATLYHVDSAAIKDWLSERDIQKMSTLPRSEYAAMVAFLESHHDE